MQDKRQQPVWFQPAFHAIYLQVCAQGPAPDPQIPAPNKLLQNRLLPLLDCLPWLDAICPQDQPGAGYVLARNMPLAAHGTMGLAAWTAPSLAEAIEAMAKYLPLRIQLFQCRTIRTRSSLALELKARTPLGEHTELATRTTLALILDLLRHVVQPGGLEAMLIDAPWQPPGSVTRVAARGSNKHQGECVASVRFPLKWAQAPNLGQNAALHQHICQAGDAELHALDVQLAGKVRSLLHNHSQEWPTLANIADSLGMSRRTLIRKLDDEGLTYRLLLSEARNALAKWYLRSTPLPLGAIAELVGFTDAGNFHRAFRRAEGQTPGTYRKSAQRNLHQG